MARFSAKRCGHMLASRFREFLKNPRTYAALAYAVIMAAVTTIMFKRLAVSFSQVFNVFEPFVYFFSNPSLLILPLAGIFMALCDTAQLSSTSLYMLLRCRRSEWWAAELLFTVIVIAGFYVIMLLFSMLLVAANSYMKDTWSVFATTSAYGNTDLSLIASMYTTPATAALFTLVFQILHALALVQITMAINIATNHNKGAALAVAIEIICYCMSLFDMDWFKPFSIFDRSMLAFNGMNTSMMWQTVAFYALIFAAAIAVQRATLKHHCFTGIKSE